MSNNGVSLLETAELSPPSRPALSDDERVALINTQFDLKSADFPVVVLLAGDDRHAINEVLHRLGRWLDERYVRTAPFAPPTDEEQERPRFWRYWRALPRAGQIGVIVGGWAQGTCVGCISGDDSKAVFVRRTEHDMNFERCLVDDGALVLKFWLHLSKKEHGKRLKAARKSPVKSWYVDERDWRAYENFEQAMVVIDDYLTRTSTVEAPWHVFNSSDIDAAGITFIQTLLAAVSDRLSRQRSQRSVAPAASPVIEGSPTVLDAVDLTKSLEKAEYDVLREKYSGQLKKLARRAAEARQTTILVFEGWDAAGKGGIIRRIKRALDPLNSRVVPISAPSSYEDSYHYLWRFWRELPRAGSTLFFDRSWYGRVLIERVEGLANDAEWTRAYTEINDFEAQLVEHGYLVLKFWLHIDRETQLQRFRDREQTPYKKYKITEEDYRNRQRWDEYVQAVHDMVVYANSEQAPWHLIPANDKRWARIDVMRTICEALKARLQ